MASTDLRFFTNENGIGLRDRFNDVLSSYTKYFDVLVGYFRSTGFHKLYESLDTVEKIRILVGFTVDQFTVQMIDQANDEIIYSPLTEAEGTEAINHEIEKEYADSADSEKVEKGVNIFLEWIKKGKIEIRMYTKHPCHAKVYIMRKDPAKLKDTFGTVITGSSNFSTAGLIDNIEFNVELKDEPDVKFALERFEEMWKEGTEVTADFVDNIEKKTWIRNDITPYEIYLKTLYEFFKEEINADKDGMTEELVPDGYMRLQYQIDAVIQAKKTLDAYGGTFISDVVGLGKTYICAMLAKSLGKGKKLIICPPVLVDYWKSVLLEFDVAATVESLGKLQSLIDSGIDDYKYVFIDEAHRFRNQKTEGYTLLHAICKNKKVILVSATPMNNYLSDIESQIYLFQPKHNSTIIPNRPDIEKFFAELRSKENLYSKDSAAYKKQVKENSELIRDNILRHIMVRRTRSEIAEYYKEDLKKQGLSFPKVGSPEKIVYEFDEKTDKAFKETMYEIQKFNYARYKPLAYLPENKKYTTLLTGQENIGGFMKAVLVKRLESSFYAFRKTISRFIESYEKFIDMFKQGDIYFSKKIDVYDLLDNGDDEKLMKLVEEGDVFHFRADEFDERFPAELESDLAKLKYLQKLWNGIDNDPKLNKFIEELTSNKKLLSGSKKIIFTESKETSDYLYENLHKIYGDRVVSYSSTSSMALKYEIDRSFNPRNYQKENDHYDVLITTDILSEGINLHLSNLLINYDLPWNPTRIMQRVGRINRVGTTFDQIYVFNFFPTAQSDKQLPLKDRILVKLQAFHDTLGEDAKYLSDEEVVSPQKLFDDLTGDLNDKEESSNPELHYLTLIREIRDKDEKLFNHIKNLPQKAKTGKVSAVVPAESTLSFIRKGALKTFFITKGQDTTQLTFMQAVRFLESDVNEEKISIGSLYYDQLELNKKKFDSIQKEDEVITTDKPSVKGNDAKVLKTLKAIRNCQKFTEEEEENIDKMIEMVENGEIPSKLSKIIAEKIMKSSDEISAYHVISNSIPENYFDKKNTSSEMRAAGQKQIVLSCYMKPGEIK